MYDYYPVGKYCYKCLPMGVANYPDIFQHKMNYLFHVFKFIHAYIDDLLVLTKGAWKYHVQILQFKEYFIDLRHWIWFMI